MFSYYFFFLFLVLAPLLPFLFFYFSCWCGTAAVVFYIFIFSAAPLLPFLLFYFFGSVPHCPISTTHPAQHFYKNYRRNTPSLPREGTKQEGGRIIPALIKGSGGMGVGPIFLQRKYTVLLFLLPGHLG